MSNDSPQLFDWERFGLKLHIPKGSLPVGMEQCTINIKASLSGQYKFPDDSNLVSAIFWFHCEPECCFKRQISIEIQHCAQSANFNNLSFVRASSAQKLPFIFRHLGGYFTDRSSYGVLQLSTFSGLGVAQRGSNDRDYCASLFYHGNTERRQEVHFVVTWNVAAHLTVITANCYAGMHLMYTSVNRY